MTAVEIDSSLKGFINVEPLFRQPALTIVHPDFGSGHFFAILGVKVTP